MTGHDSQAGQAGFADLLTPEMLAERLADDDFRLFDASWHMPNSGRDARAEYAQVCIPGARFFDIEQLSDRFSDLPHMLPSPEGFLGAMASVGVTRRSAVVVYDSVGMFSAPRAWWMFKVFGFDRVAVLDGGLPAWRRAGLEVVAGAVNDLDSTSVEPGADVAGSVGTARLIDRSEVLVASAALSSDLSTDDSNPRAIIDARAADRFFGRAPEPRPGLPSGHIPGSVNLPFGAVLNADGGLKSEAELAEIFTALGVRNGDHVVTSCGSGVTACILALALERVGCIARVYDGSWAEWASVGDKSLIATSE